MGKARQDVLLDTEYGKDRLAKHGWSRLGATIVLTIAAGSAHTASPDANRWRFAVGPYLWLPNVSGDLGFSGSSSTGGGRLDVGMRPDSYLQNLQFLLMLQAEASKGNWTILADAAYLDFSH